MVWRATSVRDMRYGSRKYISHSYGKEATGFGLGNGLPARCAGRVRVDHSCNNNMALPLFLCILLCECDMR